MNDPVGKAAAALPDTVCRFGYARAGHADSNGSRDKVGAAAKFRAAPAASE